MAIKHAFNNLKVDGGDATKTRPSDWNADHVIDDNTIPIVKLSNASATQRLLARNSAGAGAWQEVTATQMLDWVSNTNGVLLTRTGGTWGVVTNWASDNGDLVANENATPAAAPAGKVRLFASLVGGRGMPAGIGPAGERQVQQPFLAQRNWWSITPRIDNAASLGNVVNTRSDAQGTLTTRTAASTNMFTAAHRAGYVSAAGAGSIAGLRHAGSWCHRGNATKAGGFMMFARFGISDAVLVATANMFVGITATTGSLGDVGPETLVNLFGVGCTNGDTQLQLYAADGSARARTALGASFPCNTINTDLYEWVCYCPANGADIRYELIRLNTGDRVTGTVSASANLPVNTTFLTWQVHRSNGGTAAAVGIDILSLYGESDF